MNEKELEQLSESITTGDMEASVELTRRALAEGINPQEIISRHMIRGMQEIGARFEAGEAYVPELLMAARAMKGSLELIKPLLQGDKNATLGKAVIGTVYGDLHDIGKNLVSSMMEGCGFDVVNLGVNVTADKFVEAAVQEQADLILCSSLLTTTMGYLQTVVEAVDRAGLRPKVKIMVGGAPVTQAFATQIGADGYSENANAAVKEAKRLMGL